MNNKLYVIEILEDEIFTTSCEICSIEEYTQKKTLSDSCECIRKKEDH